jgi:hypothetical protein
MVPAINDKYHPAAPPAVRTISGFDVPDQLKETADISGVNKQSDPYDLEFRDMCRDPVGYRGPTPCADYGDSSNYFVVLRNDGTVGGFGDKCKTSTTG